MNELTIKQDTTSLSEKISEMVVTDQRSYEDVADQIKDIIHFRKKIEAFCKPNIDAAIETKRVAEEGRKVAIAQQETLIAPVKEVEKIGQRKMRKYEDDKVEKERLDKVEADRKAQELTEAAEDAAFSGEDDKVVDELLDQAENEEIKSEQMRGSSMKKVSGCGIRRLFDVEVLDEALIPREYLIVDFVKLRAEARELKHSFNVPGCRAFIKDI